MSHKQAHAHALNSKGTKTTFHGWLPLDSQKRSSIFDPQSGYKYTAENLCQAE